LRNKAPQDYIFAHFVEGEILPLPPVSE